MQVEGWHGSAYQAVLEFVEDRESICEHDHIGLVWGRLSLISTAAF